jgi:hypothetical protein
MGKTGPITMSIEIRERANQTPAIGDVYNQRNDPKKSWVVVGLSRTLGGVLLIHYAEAPSQYASNHGAAKVRREFTLDVDQFHELFILVPLVAEIDQGSRWREHLRNVPTSRPGRTVRVNRFTATERIVSTLTFGDTLHRVQEVEVRYDDDVFPQVETMRANAFLDRFDPVPEVRPYSVWVRKSSAQRDQVQDVAMVMHMTEDKILAIMPTHSMLYGATLVQRVFVRKDFLAKFAFQRNGNASLDDFSTADY